MSDVGVAFIGCFDFVEVSELIQLAGSKEEFGYSDGQSGDS
jgi:hypothetical protein